MPDGEPSRYVGSSGYVVLRWLVAPGEYVECREHRLVLDFPDGDVHHVNGDKLDNRPENLAVLTKIEHAELHGHGPHKPPGWQRRRDREARRALVEQQWAKIAADYRAGLSLSDLSRKYPLTSPSLSRGLRARGVQMRPAVRPPAPLDLDVVRRLHADGASAASICAATGAGRARVDAALDRLGLPRRRVGRPRRR